MASIQSIKKAHEMVGSLPAHKVSHRLRKWYTMTERWLAKKQNHSKEK